MAVDATKIALGPCDVKFNNVDLGATKGGVVVNYSQEFYTLTVDQNGSTPMAETVSGEKATIEVPLVEQDLQKLAALIPGAAYSAGQLLIGGGVGTNLLDIAKTLELTPKSGKTTDKVCAPKAAPKPSIQATYGEQGERIYKIVFECYPDASGRMLKLG